MKSPTEMLQDAKQAKPRELLKEYRDTIVVLRQKNFSWREIAQFLAERGVETDHSQVFRFMKQQAESKPENLSFLEDDMPTNRAYDAVKTLVRKHHGEMTAKPAGRGVNWILSLENRTLEVRIPKAPNCAAELNKLDYLYKTLPGVKTPQTWKDFSTYELVDDAFWKLMQAFLVPGK